MLRGPEVTLLGDAAGLSAVPSLGTPGAVLLALVTEPGFVSFRSHPITDPSCSKCHGVYMSF